MGALAIEFAKLLIYYLQQDSLILASFVSSLLHPHFVEAFGWNRVGNLIHEVLTVALLVVPQIACLFIVVAILLIVFLILVVLKFKQFSDTLASALNEL